MILLKIAFLLCLFGGWLAARYVLQDDEGWLMASFAFLWGVVASAIGIVVTAAIFVGFYWVVCL